MVVGRLDQVNGQAPMLPLPESGQSMTAEQARDTRTPDIDELSRYIGDCYRAARDHHQKYVQPVIEKCQRMYSGEYEPEDLAIIEKTPGTKVYLRKGRAKCAMAKAKIRAKLRAADKLGSRPWTIEPSPLPDLPPEEEANLLGHLAENQVPVELGEARKLRLDNIRKLAEDRAKAMSDKVDDILKEGCWDKATSDFEDYLTQFPFAAITGELRCKKRRTWANGAYKVDSVAAWHFYAVHPKDLFPAPNVRDLQDSYICERVVFSRGDLAAMRGVDGWSAEAINRVLLRYRGTDQVLSTDDTQALIKTQDNKDLSINDGEAPGMIRAVRFHGSVPNYMLEEWGIPTTGDENDETEISAVQVGDICVRAIANPDSLGQKPYWGTSFSPVANQFWGEGVLQNSEVPERILNALWRGIINNAAIISQPAWLTNKKALNKFDGVFYPGIIIDYNPAECMGMRPIEQFQTKSVIEQLLPLKEQAEVELDNASGVQRYDQGQSSVDTATTLSMYMGASDTLFEDVVAAVAEEVQQKPIEYLVAWLNESSDTDPSIKGDCNVVVIGAQAAAQREIQQKRRMEFASSILPADPEYGLIVGTKGKRLVLEGITGDLGWNIVPSEEEMAARMAEEAQQRAMQQGIMGAQGAIPSGQVAV